MRMASGFRLSSKLIPWILIRWEKKNRTERKREGVVIIELGEELGVLKRKRAVKNITNTESYVM